ncbi:MAG: glycosyltransferase [Anaerolineales bacterium]|nr:glycosyltransferase [Anaerolineales bacterium]
MLSGHNIVYFGPEKWDGLWRNRHWLMSLFARRNAVLYVEPQLSLRRTLAEWRRGGRVALAPWRWQPTTHIQAGLHVYHPPPFAPKTKLPALGPITGTLRRGLLRSAARRLGLQDPIVWISRPDLAATAGILNPRLTIYHVVDEYSGYPGKSEAERARQRAAELPVLRKADLVIVSSRALLEAKRPHNPRTFLVPNGVNLAGYQRQIERGAPDPPELAAIPRPRLGMIGLIGSTIDFDLLETAARAQPAWSLVMVGAPGPKGVGERWSRLLGYANLHYLGQAPAERVPEFVCGFDVGLIPYAQTGHRPFINPLKLYDYLAAGIPVASVDLPSLDGFRHVVHVGDGPAGYVAAIEAALADRGAARAAERRRLAAENSWERRVEAAAQVIENALAVERAPQEGGRTVELGLESTQGPLA